MEKEKTLVVKNNIFEIPLTKYSKNAFKWLIKSHKNPDRDLVDNKFFIKGESIATTNGFCVHAWHEFESGLEDGTYDFVALGKKKILLEKVESSAVFTQVFDLLAKDPEPISNIEAKTVYVNRSFQAKYLIDALWVNNFFGHQFTNFNFYRDFVKIKQVDFDSLENTFEAIVMRCENFTDPIIGVPAKEESESKTDKPEPEIQAES